MKPKKKNPNKITSRKTVSIAALSLLLGVLMVSSPCNALADNTKLKGPGGKEPITITSDNATAFADKKMAEFTGNVYVIQGKSELKTDKLTLFFKESPEKGSKTQETQKSRDRIKKIIAVGNVYVSMEDKNGECERAEYTAETETIVLTGKKTVLRDGKNHITGEKIVYNRKTGKIDVGVGKSDGGKKKRVKAVFYTEGKGLQ